MMNHNLRVRFKNTPEQPDRSLHQSCGRCLDFMWLYVIRVPPWSVVCFCHCCDWMTNKQQLSFQDVSFSKADATQKNVFHLRQSTSKLKLVIWSQQQSTYKLFVVILYRVIVNDEACSRWLCFGRWCKFLIWLKAFGFWQRGCSASLLIMFFCTLKSCKFQLVLSLGWLAMQQAVKQSDTSDCCHWYHECYSGENLFTILELCPALLQKGKWRLQNLQHSSVVLCNLLTQEQNIAMLHTEQSNAGKTRMFQS